MARYGHRSGPQQDPDAPVKIHHSIVRKVRPCVFLLTEGHKTRMLRDGVGQTTAAEQSGEESPGSIGQGAG